MYTFFGGVTKILAPDNCKTAVIYQKGSWYTPKLNASYHELTDAIWRISPDIQWRFLPTLT